MTNPTIPAALGDFAFPPLGDTGKGPVQHEGKHGALYWRPDGSWRYYVTLQHDVPAVPGQRTGGLGRCRRGAHVRTRGSRRP